MTMTLSNTSDSTLKCILHLTLINIKSLLHAPTKPAITCLKIMPDVQVANILFIGAYFSKATTLLFLSWRTWGQHCQQKIVRLTTVPFFHILTTDIKFLGCLRNINHFPTVPTVPYYAGNCLLCILLCLMPDHLTCQGRSSSRESIKSVSLMPWLYMFLSHLTVCHDYFFGAIYCLPIANM